MKKLLTGIVEFRKSDLKKYREKYSNLIHGQSPDALMIACSDSRVVPNMIASLDPGDLFVVRNVGNLISPCDEHGYSSADESEVAALEFAVSNLNVKDVIICGHSDCGAMRALVKGRESVPFPHLRSWLRHGDFPCEKVQYFPQGVSLKAHDQLSCSNVLKQLEHLRTFPEVNERVEAGRLRLHAWWFEIESANIYAFDSVQHQFILIDEAEAVRIMSVL